MAGDITKDDLAKLLDAVTLNQADLFTKLSEAAQSNAQLYAALKGNGQRLELETSTSKVFRTPELAEAIFQQVDFAALLLAQAVCRHWQRIIRTSIMLRRKLHLAPEQGEHVRALPVAPPHTVVVSSGLFMIDLSRVKEQRSISTGYYDHPSWESMTPTQPPAQKMNCSFLCDNTSGSRKRELRAVDSNGITLMQMHRAARAWLDEHRKVSCREKMCRRNQNTTAFFEILHS
ncbi:hypothetical protein LTR85_000245 [Meristemomyces frigidus]|nr:hypothetical protein LTR85_000245 [Meristemomyces frigidus]